jgi:hypothetical protein
MQIITVYMLGECLGRRDGYSKLEATLGITR